MKKKDIIGLQRQNKTKINPHCGVKTDYWTHEVRHIKSFAPTSVLYDGLSRVQHIGFINQHGLTLVCFSASGGKKHSMKLFFTKINNIFLIKAHPLQYLGFHR